MARKPKYYVRPDGLHEAIRVVNGKRVAFRGSSDAEVERRMIEYRERIAKGRPFSEVAEEWEGIHFPTLAANSLKNYWPALKRAIDEFGDEPIKEIKAPNIKRFINEFAHGGRAWKTVTTQRLILSLVFDYAVTEGEIEYNPCASVKVPKGLAKSFRDAASIEDEERVKKYAKGWLLPYLIIYTGLRKGEALGLTYDDIDRKNLVIWVRRSVYHTDDGKPYTKEPKTEAGERQERDRVQISPTPPEKRRHPLGCLLFCFLKYLFCILYHLDEGLVRAGLMLFIANLVLDIAGQSVKVLLRAGVVFKKRVHIAVGHVHFNHLMRSLPPRRTNYA